MTSPHLTEQAGVLKLKIIILNIKLFIIPEKSSECVCIFFVHAGCPCSRAHSVTPKLCPRSSVRHLALRPFTYQDTPCVTRHRVQKLLSILFILTMSFEQIVAAKNDLNATKQTRDIFT